MWTGYFGKLKAPRTSVFVLMIYEGLLVTILFFFAGCGIAEGLCRGRFDLRMLQA